ncbi:MAG: putative Ig domain-containing protein, partial [Terriglobales bacterium]
SLNGATGAITGKPTGPQVGAISFTVTVTDAESPAKTANANLSITISAPALTITTGSEPTGVLNQSYSGSLSATGGITPYTWSISAGSLPPGLTLNASTGAITGTDSTETGTFGFTVQVTDSESPTPSTTTKGLSITINNSAPLQITTTGLPVGVINTSYSNAFLNASGGIQPYTWSYTGSLPPGLTLNTSTGQISGTPTSTGTFSFTAKVTDSSSPVETATAGLSITVDGSLTITTTSVPNGSVNTQYNATANASGGILPYNWNLIGGSLPPGLNYGTNNNSLNISGQPTTTGTYPFTMQVTDNQGDTASQGYTIVIGTEPAAYTVSGTVSYSGSKTGWVYLQLQPNGNNCGNCGNNLGTSISEATLTSGGAFTIHGVQPGTYTLQAYMDNLGYGAQNASNPTGSVSNVTVTASPVTGVGVTLADPGTVTISSAPSWNSGNGSGAFSGGAFVSFQSIQNNNGIEMPASYTVEWSTSSSCSSPAGSKSFPASGGNNPWIVNGLTNGTTYYFCARGVAGSSTGPWSAPSSGITINAPSGGNAVSGKVTFSETAKGPLYVGFYNQSTGQIYADVVGSQASPPTSPASYTVSVPTGSNYYFFGILDQNNSGLIAGPGQVSNTNENNMAPVSISGTTTNENLTLPSANSIAVVRTQSTEQINSDGTSTNYSIGFNVNGLLKLPVAVELTSGPTPGVVMPADIADGGFNGNSDQFSYWTSLNGATPKVGDSYSLKVTYSDGTSETLTATVGAVLNAFATNLSPQGSGVSATPNFSWTDPANASSYTYQFWLCCDSNGTIWQIPGNNSKSNGFSSSINSITWGVDPTNSGNLPNVSSLNGSTNYSWQIQATDVNGNSAQVQVNFETVETPLSLPAAGSVGNAVVGQSWGGAINASGGVPNYTFTVNGNTVPTDGTQVSLGDNLYAWNTGGNTLSLGGTPTTATTVSFTVGVTDSSSPNQTAGPFTYSITVSAAAALSIETLSLPGGNNGWAYTTSVKATGGVQPYTWSIISGSLPGGLSPSSNGGSNLTIAGTPSATGTTSFTVQVEDSESPPVKVSQALSITITNCTYTALNGNYAFESNGWDSSGTTTAASAIGSFVANGAGTISSGLIDVSDQANVSGPQSGTVTGTYCVGPNNLAVINLTYGGGLSGGNIFAASLDSSDGNGHIISYDSSNLQASGLLRKQTTSAFSTSKIDGNYAFGLVGVDQNASRFGLAGEFSSNGSGTLSGQADYDQSCSGGCGSGSSGNTTLSSSNFTVASTGRGTAGMYITAPAVTVNFVFYVVSSSEMLMMAYDNTETPSMVFAGQVLQQSASLTDASLNGNSVIELVGLDNSNSQAVPDVQAGLINASGTGTFTLTMDENDGGTFDNGTGSPSPISGDYSVGTGGRVTLSNITGCPGGCGGHSPIFYLVGLNKAFVIDTSGEVSVGTITPQTGSSFTQASFNGNYLNGSQPPVIADNGEEVDSFAANGAGTFNVTTYKNSGCDGCGSPQLGAQAISGLDYTVSSNGRVVVTCGPTTGANCGPSGTEVGIIYMISTSQGVFFITQDSNPRLMDYHQ